MIIKQLFDVTEHCRMLLPILTTLEYNQWFTKLTIADIKLVSNKMILFYMFAVHWQRK